MTNKPTLKDWIKQEQKLPEVGRRYKVKDYDDNIKSIILNGKTTVLTIIKLEHVLPYVYFESYRVVDSMRLIEKTKLRLDNFWHNFEELSEQDHIVDENKKVNKEVQEALNSLKLTMGSVEARHMKGETGIVQKIYDKFNKLVNALEPKEHLFKFNKDNKVKLGKKWIDFSVVEKKYKDFLNKSFENGGIEPPKFQDWLKEINK